MFRITFMVEDDHLVEIIRKVRSVAINLSVTDNSSGAKTPIRAAQSKSEESLANGAMKTKGVQSLDRIIAAMREHNITTFKASMFREILKRSDLNTASYSHYIRELVKYGCLSKLGRGTNVTYQFIDRP